MYIHIYNIIHYNPSELGGAPLFSAEQRLRRSPRGQYGPGRWQRPKEAGKHLRVAESHDGFIYSYGIYQL